MNFDQAMEFIGSYSKSGKPVKDLSRAEDLMERIGNPEKSLKFVHVAGTNGKGSTVEYISNALIYSGYKTGQFTSPFVLHYTDRIRINGTEIDEDSLCTIAEFVRERAADQEYSQFEITMAIALLWFEREGCDIVVLEAGIGGLLDCTNVIPPPLVSVITSVSLDHTAILGDTVEKIARQKAGIIKKGSAVVVNRMNSQDIVSIFREKACEAGAELIYCRNDAFMPMPQQGLNLRGQPFRYRDVIYTPAMSGTAQPFNAITAIETCYYLRKKGFVISDDNIKKSVETSAIKARMQFIDGTPPVIVDGGHNIGGIIILSFQLRHMRYVGKKRYIVMGMIDSKDYEESVELISKLSDGFFAVDGFAPNAVPAEKLAEIAGRNTSSKACSSLEEAVGKAKALALENDGVVVVCGSLYLASQYLNIYEN